MFSFLLENLNGTHPWGLCCVPTTLCCLGHPLWSHITTAPSHPISHPPIHAMQDATAASSSGCTMAECSAALCGMQPAIPTFYASSLSPPVHVSIAAIPTSMHPLCLHLFIYPFLCDFFLRPYEPFTPLCEKLMAECSAALCGMQPAIPTFYASSLSPPVHVSIAAIPTSMHPLCLHLFIYPFLCDFFLRPYEPFTPLCEKLMCSLQHWHSRFMLPLDWSVEAKCSCALTALYGSMHNCSFRAHVLLAPSFAQVVRQPQQSRECLSHADTLLEQAAVGLGGASPLMLGFLTEALGSQV